jgi:hypothetical protein
MKLTHEQRQVFRMLANARRPSGRQGEAGPLLLSDRARKLAFRLAGIGEDGTGPLTWPAKERRHLTTKECGAGLSVLKSQHALRWSKKWSYGDPEAKFVIADLMARLEQGRARSTS